MADPVFIVVHSLIGQNGSGIAHFIGSFSDEKAAKECVSDYQQSDKEMMNAKVSIDGKVVGSFGQILLNMGLHGLRTTYFKSEPRGALIVVPSLNGIMVPGTQ